MSQTRKRKVSTPTELLFKQCSRKEFDLRKLLNQGADINAHNKAGKTPLMILAEKGNLHMMDLFLLNNADIRASTPKQETVLHFANEEAIDFLLQHEHVPVKQVSSEGVSPIHHAVRINSPQSIQLLLQHDSHLHEFHASYENEIQLAMKMAIAYKNPDLFKVMLPYLHKKAMFLAFKEADALSKTNRAYRYIATVILRQYNARFSPMHQLS